MLAALLSVKRVVYLLGLVVIALAACWATGLADLTWVRVVPNEPLLHPQKVRGLSGTNMIMESGEVIALWPREASDRSLEEIYLDISNQVRRSSFEVDIEPTRNRSKLNVFIRLDSKFRDTCPPYFTVPLIWKTAGSRHREAIAYGAYLGTNSQPDGAANGRQPVRPETNQTSAAAASRR